MVKSAYELNIGLLDTLNRLKHTLIGMVVNYYYSNLLHTHTHKSQQQQHSVVNYKLSPFIWCQIYLFEVD